MNSQTGAGNGLLGNFRILETGPRLAGAVATRLFAELGADVIKVVPPGGDPTQSLGPFENENSRTTGGLDVSQNVGKRVVELDLADATGADRFKSLARDADLIVCSWHTSELAGLSLDPTSLQSLNPRAVVVYTTPFGLSGSNSENRGPDLVVFHASGIARSLIGPVENLETTPPVRAHGQQSEFVAGIAAACAGMFGLFQQESTNTGAVIDISMQEALAFMDVVGLAAPSFGKPGRPRKLTSAAGPNLAILPAADGFVAISPREERQWRDFLKLLGNPEWGSDPRFADRTLRQENADAVIGLLSEWSITRNKMDLFHLLQENHIPCFPLINPADHLDSDQLKSRNFFDLVRLGGQSVVKIPGTPYRIRGLSSDGPTHHKSLGNATGADIAWQPRPAPGIALKTAKGKAVKGNTITHGPSTELPLAGVRVADLSWVMAGPTCTRFLASMGAEVVKIETSSRPDPGRGSELYDVLGQGKLGITLNLKSENGLAAIKKLIANSDILFENFAPGVMERLGLGWDILKEVNPKLVMVSASGTGQSGPTRHYAAYGTLLQIYTGFAGLNGYPDRPASIGMAWADPLCGMLLAYVGVAALRSSRNTGTGRHIDFSMVEAVLATMPGPLLEYQLTGSPAEPAGNDDHVFSPHGVYRAHGDDSWIAIAITDQAEWEALVEAIEVPAGAATWNLEKRRRRSEEIDGLIGAWVSEQDPAEAARMLQTAGVPASESRSSHELVNDAHLNERGFFTMLKDRKGVDRLMPALPWRWQGGLNPRYGQPPALGGDTKFVLKSILGYSDSEIKTMEEAGALD